MAARPLPYSSPDPSPATTLCAVEPGSPSAVTLPPVAFSADGVADAALLAQRNRPGTPICHACDAIIEGEVMGSGLFLWTRGDEARFEEPPLCESCATAIGVTALTIWADAEEG